MLVLALGVLVLAGLVALGRRPLMARGPARAAGLVMAALAASLATYDAARGGWLGGSILATAALWLAGSSPQNRSSRPEAMSASDASAMLGVAQGAGRAEIEAAYRRLMLRAHPDQGGSAGLAAQLNAARARLLRR